MVRSRMPIYLPDILDGDDMVMHAAADQSGARRPMQFCSNHRYPRRRGVLLASVALWPTDFGPDALFHLATAAADAALQRRRF